MRLSRAPHYQQRSRSKNLDPSDPKAVQKFVRDYPDLASEVSRSALIETITRQFPGPIADKLTGHIQGIAGKVLGSALEKGLDEGMKNTLRPRVPHSK